MFNFTVFVSFIINKFVLPFISNMSLMLDENNGKRWSTTRFGSIFFVYPAITYVFIMDSLKNGLDWENMTVYGLLVIAPRTISNILSAKHTPPK